jgi:WD40 repeat protein
VAFSPDGNQIAVGGAGNEVNIYEVETGRKASTFSGHEGGIYTVRFHPNGHQVATAGFDGTIRIYETQSGNLFKAFVPVPLNRSSVSMK